MLFFTVAKYNGTEQTEHSAASHSPSDILNSCSLYNRCKLFLKSWIWVLIDALYSTNSLDWSWLSFMDNCAYSCWKQKVSFLSMNTFLHFSEANFLRKSPPSYIARSFSQPIVNRFTRNKKQNAHNWIAYRATISEFWIMHSHLIEIDFIYIFQKKFSSSFKCHSKKFKTLNENSKIVNL